MTQAVNLANFANNLDSSGGLSPNALNAPTPISKGGTGASTAAGAATALAAAFGNLLYPVGSIYINATDSTNPNSLLGFGTWVAFGAGRVPVGFDGTNPNFNASEKTGGSQDAVVVSHTHTAGSSVSDPGHIHSPAVNLPNTLWNGGNSYIGNGTNNFSGGGGSNFGYGGTAYPSAAATTGITVATTVNATGAAGTNANLQPYITVYMWKRTA